MIQDE